ncbi:MAG: hypothetical protein ACI4K7_12050, partial [Oscillospiraceae bacterium]
YAAYDKIPRELIDEIYIENISDWLSFLPEELPAEFTTADMAERGMNIDTARLVMNVFRKADIARIVGKKGNTYIYSLNFFEEDSL